MEISPDNWKEIKELFEAALDEEPARRWLISSLAQFGPRNDFRRSATRNCPDYGYRFGYRHQLGDLTLAFANFYRSRHLGRSGITVNFAYFSMINGVLRRLKIRRDY
jgi:hypothetical protein